MAQISFFKPALFRKDMDAVLQTMVDEKIGPGEKKRLFIKSYSTLLGRSDGVALRTYIDAIEIALSSFNLEKGDSVALSVFTPLVYLEALKRLSLKPYICDIDSSMMPSIESISSGMDEGVKALILFLPLGNICLESEKFKELGIPILEDVTQSVGSKLNEIKCANVGDVIIANTEEDAVVSTAGGAVLLSSDDEKIEFMKKTVNPYIELPDMNASLGIVQLDKLDSIVIRRSSIFKIYQEEARRKNRVKVFGFSDIEYVNNGYGFSCITEDRPEDVIEMAKKYGVTVRKTFSKACGSLYLKDYEKFPNAFSYLSRSVSFPLYPFLSKAEIETVQKTIGILR